MFYYVLYKFLNYRIRIRNSARNFIWIRIRIFFWIRYSPIVYTWIYKPQGEWLAIWTIRYHMWIMCRILASVSIMFGYSNMNSNSIDPMYPVKLLCVALHSVRFRCFSTFLLNHLVTCLVGVNSKMTPFKFSSSYHSSPSLYIILLE